MKIFIRYPKRRPKKIMINKDDTIKNLRAQIIKNLLKKKM